MYCIISFVSLAIVISMLLSTFNPELDIFLLLFHIPIAVKSFKTITTGFYFCSVQKESIVKENIKTIKCRNIYDIINVKQQTIKPTNISLTIFKFYDKMIEIIFSAVDSLSSINSIFNIWSCNKHIKRVCIY